jgi:hypothetical protein
VSPLPDTPLFACMYAAITAHQRVVWRRVRFA